MRYNITFSCGHEGSVQIYGNKSEREYKKQWWETEGECPECFQATKQREKERREKAIEEQNQKAAALAKETGLPELQGTPKQVKWALAIRQQFIELSAKAVEVKESGVDVYSLGKLDIAGTMSQKDIKDNIFDMCRCGDKELRDFVIERTTSAAEWIENRDFFGFLLRKYKKEFEAMKEQTVVESVETIEIETVGTIETEITEVEITETIEIEKEASTMKFHVSYEFEDGTPAYPEFLKPGIYHEVQNVSQVIEQETERLLLLGAKYDKHNKGFCAPGEDKRFFVRIERVQNDSYKVSGWGIRTEHFYLDKIKAGKKSYHWWETEDGQRLRFPTKQEAEQELLDLGYVRKENGRFTYPYDRYDLANGEVQRPEEEVVHWTLTFEKDERDFEKENRKRAVV